LPIKILKSVDMRRVSLFKKMFDWPVNLKYFGCVPCVVFFMYTFLLIHLSSKVDETQLVAKLQ